MQAAKIRIGTRGSPLALAQAREVVAPADRGARARAQDACEIVVIKTTGDRITDRPLIEAGGKGLFTKEIEEALLAGDDRPRRAFDEGHADVLPPGLTHRRHAEAGRSARRLRQPQVRLARRAARGAVVGTSSPRRQAQVLHRRPDLKIVPLRGNVRDPAAQARGRRGRRARSSPAPASTGSASPQHITRAHAAPTSCCPPWRRAPSAIEIRADDAETARLIAPLNDAATALVRRRRARVPRPARRLVPHADRGPCRAARRRRCAFAARSSRPTARSAYATERSGAAQAALRLGEEAAAELLDRAGPDFLRALA